MRHLSPLLALSLALLACTDFEELPPGGTLPPPDDLGDWRDTGPFASCGVRLDASQCGSPEAFQPTGCAASGLTAPDVDGVYTLHVRARNPANDFIGFSTQALRLSSSGGEELAGGLPVETRHEGAGGSLYLAASRTDAVGNVRRRAYLGCHAPEPGRMQGCYVECSNGRVVSEGTFDARKVTPRPEEPVSSGLELLSETAPPAGLHADVYVTHGHAYVVSLGGGLSVYDVSDPARPVLTERVHNVNDDDWNAVWAYKDALYVASAERGVIVFDLKDPAHPVQVLSTPRQRTNVHTLFVAKDLLFAAAPAPGAQVLIFNLEEPLTPILAGTFQVEGVDVGPNFGPHDMFVFEKRLYVNFWRAGYVIASLAHIPEPRQLGVFRNANATSHASAVARYGDRLIAFEGGEDWGAHLRVLDVTDPAAVKRIGEYRLREHISIHNLVLSGTKLYVAYYHEGVRVLDVSVPEAPREVAHYNTFRPEDPGRGAGFYDGAIGIRVPGDGYIYAVDTSRGLLILRETATAGQP